MNVNRRPETPRLETEDLMTHNTTKSMRISIRQSVPQAIIAQRSDTDEPRWCMHARAVVLQDRNLSLLRKPQIFYNG